MLNRFSGEASRPYWQPFSPLSSRAKSRDLALVAGRPSHIFTIVILSAAKDLLLAIVFSMSGALWKPTASAVGSITKSKLGFSPCATPAQPPRLPANLLTPKNFGDALRVPGMLHSEALSVSFSSLLSS